MVDQTGTLDAIQLKGLQDKLMAFEQKKGTQIAILMVPTTQPEDIASYANRVGNDWKIGRKEVGDGVLLVVAKDDRKVRIEVAKTLEGAIPDLAAKQIIDDAITPNFRKQDFAGGLHAAVDQLIARITGEALPAPKAPAQRGAEPGIRLDGLGHLPVHRRAGGRRRAARHPGTQARRPGDGRGVGVVALLITSSLVVAAIAAFVALLFSMLSGGGFGSRGSGGERRALYRRLGRGRWWRQLGWRWRWRRLGQAPAVAATSGAAAPRGTGDGAGKELATHPRPRAAASLAGRVRRAPGRSRPTCWTG